MFEVLIFNGIDHKVCALLYFSPIIYFSSSVCLLVGIVSQEPVRFDMSIRENIAYADNSRKDIPLDEII